MVIGDNQPPVLEGVPADVTLDCNPIHLNGESIEELEVISGPGSAPATGDLLVTNAIILADGLGLGSRPDDIWT